MRSLGLVVIVVASMGCAASHSVTSLGGGVTVHTFRRDYSNAHVVARGEAYFMVDSGLELNAPALADDLRREGFDPARLQAIILTHGHADHAGGAGYFRERFGTRVVVGAPDAALLSAGANDRLCPTDQSASHRLASDQAARFTPFTADVAIDAEVPLETVTTFSGAIVPMPGHTAGSLALLMPGAALVGDLLRGAIIGGTAERHFYMCDLEGNHRDVRTLVNRLVDPDARFFVGHFGPVSRTEVAERFR